MPSDKAGKNSQDGMEHVALLRVVREGLPGKITFELRPEGSGE